MSVRLSSATKRLKVNGFSPRSTHSTDSLPLVTVNGRDDVTIQMNGTILELTDLNGTITMDSELEEAWAGDQSANSLMNGEFLRLKAGYNAYSWEGDVSSVIIQPRWRTL